VNDHHSENRGGEAKKSHLRSMERGEGVPVEESAGIASKKRKKNRSRREKGGPTKSVGVEIRGGRDGGRGELLFKSDRSR